METSMSGWSTTEEILANNRLDKLDPAMLARYESRISDAMGRRTCTEHTRQETLTAIEVWCDNRDAPMVYWLNGMAGTGKTTIAYTLASKLESRGQLGASFFCTVTSDECRKASTIIPTIAYQLARQSTPFQAALGQSLKKEPDAAKLSISKQFELLIVEPLDNIAGKMARNLIVVIDALDECYDDNVVSLILDSLFSSDRKLPLKFLITSRPEPAIYERLLVQSDTLRTLLHLHEVNEESIQRDIKLYLREGLVSVRHSEDEIDKLAALSGRLFIYAATAVRYIVPRSISVDSRSRLNTMLGINTKPSKKHSAIDALYSSLLSGAIENKDLEIDERDNILSVLWAIVSSPHPVPLEGVVKIAELDDEVAALAALAPLRSVLHISHTNTVSLFHASFSEFIFDQSRSSNFYCDERVMRHRSAQRCLRFINLQPPNSFQPGIVVSPYLIYASLNWLSFITWRAPESKELFGDLSAFYGSQFEHWLRFIESYGEETAFKIALKMASLYLWLHGVGPYLKSTTFDEPNRSLCFSVLAFKLPKT
ncbi:unnamed protein product [Rhizoctonia solani]|uniref:NACHT domain-containing protein n=1 Tax=Rhizoctonia solani TaxID=456999 RepID=A0A8H2X0M1_9AGAM|nr:unnamed protein product [Rhizoctonia solani]